MTPGKAKEKILKGTGTPGNIFPAVAFFLVPFLGGNHLAVYFFTVDRFIIEAIFLLSLLLAIIFNLTGKKAIKRGNGEFLIYILPFFTISCLSFFYSWNRFMTLQEINLFLWAIGAVILYIQSDNRDSIRKALVLGACVSVIAAIIQFKVLYPNLMETFKTGRYASLLQLQYIPFSSFLYHNIFGGLLLIVLPISLYYAIEKQGPAFIVTSILIVSGIMLSTSRASIILAFIVSVFFLGKSVYEGKWKNIVRLAVIVLVGLAVAFSVVHQWRSPPGKKSASASNYVNQLQDKLERTEKDLKTLNMRTDIWRNSFTAFREKPILGYGAGAFEYAYRKYFDGGLYTKYAHSQIVKIAVELGIVGLLCYVFFLWGLFRRSRKKLKSNGGTVYLFVALVCSFLFSIVDFSFNTPAHFILFFTLASSFFTRTANEAVTEAQPAGNNKSEKAMYARTAAMFIVMACLILSFFFTGKVNLSKKSIENGEAFEEFGLATHAFTLYREAISEMPVNNEGYTQAVNCLAKIYDKEKNAGTKEEICRNILSYVNILENRKHSDSGVFAAISNGYFTCGDKDRSLEYLGKALSYYPASASYIFRLMNLYADLDQTEKALSVAASVDRYTEKYIQYNNPIGIYVYYIRDLLSRIAFREKRTGEAIQIARANLVEAQKGTYVIEDARSGIFVRQVQLVKMLKDRVELYQSKNGK